MIKKKPAVPLHYWDACTFLHAIRGTDPTPNGAILSNLQDSKSGKLKIVTSAVTIAEVVRPRSCDESVHPLPESDRAKAESVIHAYIGIIDCTEYIARRARELQWLLSPLRPMDAIHLASAEYAKVKRFDTTDGRDLIGLVKKSRRSIWKHVFDIGHPDAIQGSLPFGKKQQP